jgi:hypothetical protein
VARRATGRARMIASLRRIRRIVETQTAYRLWQLETLERLGGNPLGIAWRQLDEGAIAQMARRLPGPTYNRVIGLRGDLVGEIEPLIAWYAEAGIKPLLETISAYDDPALAGELARRDYYQSGFQVVLAAAPVVPEQGAVANAIEAVDSSGQLAAFLEVYGWPGRGASEAGLKAALPTGLHAGGVSLYLGRSQARPAAAAVLFVRDGIGYCAPAVGATANEGAGLDAALLARRIADARDAGVEWVVTQADLVSARQARLTRMGFKAAFIRTEWTSL